MAIAILLMSFLGGAVGVSGALYWGLGWALTFGAYVLGGIIGSMLSIAIALTKSDVDNSEYSRLPQSVT